MSLVKARYGKDNVRVLKVSRDPSNPKIQQVQELVVKCLLEGDIEVSYTKADNTPIVATDTVKNTTFIVAKQLPGTWPIELFGAVLADHFIKKYPHISSAHVDIEQYKWTKYDVNGKTSQHSFVHDGTELRTVHVDRYRDAAKNPETVTTFNIASGIKDLSVLKSTGSMFYGYHKDDFTTLKPTKDRILSTDVAATWHWISKEIDTLDKIKEIAKKGIFDSVYAQVVDTTLQRFATENSASVQATMYNMSTDILDKASLVETVDYELPNKHYFELDLSWHHGLKNTGTDAEVYVPQSNPNGLIKSSVGRSKL
ncbi:hypothetical protein B0I72DRAFT_136806 [Yarrowia lipolytica]|jgi:urate oxidase|uniref:Uricase n=1 Tax=Yarrowia lipolytica TaxID=4952 RepID=A0A1D8NMN3_YARLL|nr:hypothetical protein YALI1_F12895g [Yarrowia lipolytica]KAB8284046.1 hypothetical protein BKA91DRAFT_135648 [Yarrowia lipolytica]KAE8173633.1 hypothetical protein BKA90DRAFT_135281 [Yarrowia lipolytica]KAJ8055919.1 hypothetical protein LXG23DRAFT_57451 [Yarrowia lipolytica]RDW26732.1 hypothetical protein B0I71DRAFT_130363 [Yarrowia lipolytica]